MKYIYPISLILLSSYQLCFSNTISVGNATYTVPEDWTTDYAFTNRARVSDSSNPMYFEIGTGYAITAYLPDEEYRYVQDTSGFENGSIQSSESESAIIGKLDTSIISWRLLTLAVRSKLSMSGFHLLVESVRELDQIPSKCKLFVLVL